MMTAKGWPQDKAVLVIDDEQIVRDLVSRSLARVGIQVLTASDGMQGLELLSQKKFECGAVLLDWALPVFPGELIFYELRRIAPDVPIIVLSDLSEDRIAEEFEGVKPVEILRKPFRIEVLLATLIEVLV